MKKNNVIIASGIAALPFLYWGVKTVIEKYPIIKKEATDTKKETESPKKTEASKDTEVPKAKSTPKESRQRRLPRSRSAKRGSTPVREESARTALKDREVGHTDDGKSIYQGGKGGKYTISDSGKKIYRKK